MIKIYNYDEISIDEVFARDIEDTSSIEKTVSAILEHGINKIHGKIKAKTKNRTTITPVPV